MIRGPPHLAPQGLNMPQAAFNISQAQPGQHNQPQPPHPSMLNANGQPPMGMLTGAQPNANAPNAYQGMHLPQMNRASQVRNPPMMHQIQGMNPGMGANQPMVNGVGQGQHQGIPFPTAMSGPIRRAPSQPQPQGMNQAGMQGLHPAPPPMAGLGINGMPGMSGLNHMNMQRFANGRPPHLQQQQQPQQAQGQPTLQQSGGLGGDFMLTAGRPPAQGGVFPPRAPGPPSIPQPPSLPPTHQGGMPGSFPNSMTMAQQQQQQQQQMRASPHPRHPNAASTLTPGMPNNTIMPQNGVQNHPRDPSFTGFQNGVMNGMRGMPVTNGQGQFPFAASPPNGMSDLQQGMNPAPHGTPRPGHQTSLMPTPAQALDLSTNGGENPFAHMPPPSTPTRPPSQQRPHPNFQLPQQPQPGPQQPHPRQQTPQQAHASPGQHPAMVQQQHVLRPQSQPQVPQRQSPQHQQPQQLHQAQQLHQQQQQPHPVPQPPGQPGPSRTPRLTQSQLPPNMAMQNRMLPPTGQHPQMQQGRMTPKPPTPAAGAQQAPVAPNPPQGGAVPATGQMPAPGPPRMMPIPQPARAPGLPGQEQAQGQNQPEGPKIDYARLQAICPPFITDVRFTGLGIAFLERFNGTLTAKPGDMHSPRYWDELIGAYFSPSAVFKFTLWKDGQRKEAKPFEIGVPILPRFFLVTVQSGVTAINFSLSGAAETRSENSTKVEIARAAWTFTYMNGYTITLKGPLTAHISIHPGQLDRTRKFFPSQPGYALQFEHFQFDGEIIEKSLALHVLAPPRSSDTPSSGAGQLENEDERRDEPRNYIEGVYYPAEPVNAFGIPQATMRCLELAESVAQMADLFKFSREKSLGPMESLAQFAAMLRETGASQGPPMAGNAVVNNHPPTYMAGGPGDGHPPTSTSSTLYQMPAINGQHPAQQQQQAANPVNGTPKPGNALPKTPQASASTPVASAATPAAAPTPTATAMTPVTAPATLKRKAGGDTASPTVSHTEPGPKRNRKKTRS